MYITSDAIDAYSIATIAGAPYAHLLSRNLLAWPVVFILFTLPAANLLINLGYVSGAGPVLTFNRIAPFASGIGWALTWLAGERLFVRSLTAAQHLFYILASMRTRLDWALDCKHDYNDRFCNEFMDRNVSLSSQPYQVSNNWPAQQFNRFGVRRVPSTNSSTFWVPNEWYFENPSSVEKFSLEFPSFLLSMSHIIIWFSLFFIVKRYGSNNPGWFLSRFCLLLPLALFTFLMIGLSIFGLSFGANNEKEIPPAEVEKYPFVYFSDIHGFFRSTVALMDYSSAFTGILIFASSRIRSGNLPMNAIALLTAQLLPPTFFYVIRDGCNGHLAAIQPAYESFTATDATFSFDTAAVCFATTPFGPLWAVIYYTANLFYACIGPMAVLLIFIEQSFLEQFSFVDRYSKKLLALICFVFAATGLLLCMPMGTSFMTLLQYVSQSALTQISIFIVVLFIYGWHNLDADYRLMINTGEATSLVTFLLGPTSPVYTALLFTSVPALLAAKIVSVFDLLMNGMDILKHIDYGTSFMTPSLSINRLFGYGILLAPTCIVTVFAIFAFYINVVVYKMPWGSIFDATADWISHSSLRQTAASRPPPISHRILISFTKIPFRSILIVIYAAEIVIGLLLLLLFLSNAIYARIDSERSGSAAADNFRTLLLLTLVTFHVLALLELRWAVKRWDHSSRLNLYIGVATIETAFLNGYMFVAAVSHTWGLNYQPFLVIFVNTFVRGTMIAIVIAIRWSIAELSHPTRTRDATEIYDATADLDADVDHEDDAPIIYEMRRDVFT